MASAIRLKLYFQLSRNSRLSMTRRKKNWGRPHFYQPQPRLLRRLATLNRTTVEAIEKELAEERLLILRNPEAYIYQRFD